MRSLLFCVAAAVFVLLERRVTHPIVSFALWSHRPIAATNGVAVLANMALIGLTTFLPIYVQIVMQRSLTTAGLTLTTMLIGWPAGGCPLGKSRPLAAQSVSAEIV